MIFTISKCELAEVLKKVSSATSNNPAYPILANVRIETTKDGAIFETTDLTNSARVCATVLTEEDGCVCLPFKLLSDVVKTLDDAAVCFEVSGDVANISCLDSHYSLPVINSEDFPAFPSVEPTAQIEIDVDVLAQALKKALNFVAGTNDAHAVLQGVKLKAANSKLELAATDSYRLYFCSSEIDSDVEFDAVLGSWIAQKIVACSAASKLTVALSDNQIVVSCGDEAYVSRRIEGNYPDYRRLLPSSHTSSVVASLPQLAKCTKRAGAICGSVLKFSIGEQDVTLEAGTNETGYFKECIDSENNGETTDIGFNVAYLNGGLAALSSESVRVELNGSNKPAVFKPVSEDISELFLLMPVRLAS